MPTRYTPRNVVPINGPATKKPAKFKDPREIAFNKAFGGRLKDAREGKGFTQERIALGLGIGKDAYKKYEYGERGFPLYLLPVLIVLTDRPASYWLTGHG